MGGGARELRCVPSPRASSSARASNRARLDGVCVCVCVCVCAASARRAAQRSSCGLHSFQRRGGAARWINQPRGS